MKKLLSIILCLAIVFSLTACNGNNEKIAWSDLDMGEYLPEPDDTYGEIILNDLASLSIDLAKATKEDYKAYLDKCIGAGYAIDSEKDSSSYEAYNSEGYQLCLNFYEYNEELSIHLYAPEEMSEFEWPTSGLGAMLPATKSKLGDVSWNTSKTFIVHVGNTTLSEYNEYVKACESKGFNIDFSKEDNYYSAKNAGGYHLTLRYLGFNKIEISLDADDITNNSPATSTSTTSINSKSSSTATSNEIGTEFKEAMDSYEEFFDEYVAFMKKYKDSNGTDLSLISDYTKYLTKYTELMQEFENWENKELNSAELAYYIQVQGRITQKLLEVTQ